MKKIRVLVVDDTAVMRKIVSEVINRDPDMEVAGVASNGKIAMQRISQYSPDAITLDLEMPEMDGIAMVKELRKTYPKIPVIMLSSQTYKGAESTFEALQAGANDYVAKPSTNNGLNATMSELNRELIPKIKQYFHVLAPQPVAPPSAPRPNRTKARRSGRLDVLAIGSSTGGPNALSVVFSSIREPLPVPVVVVQHMPPLFTKALAERLNRESCLTICEGEHGQALRPGHVYIAPGGQHMETRRRGAEVVLHLHEGPQEHSCRPAADVLFRSVAKCYGGSALAVVLTGMGRDGFLGAREICEAGGEAIAQDKETSVVWGMPSFLVNEGLVEKGTPLPQVASAISSRFSSLLQKY
ncbi:protein-glutamate methylesterase/protein-glutamine glutaminase [Pelagicoccus albus]|uniref:Protein-glutamate methylesterase/protein-glutamine glutaminase n=1 Tax=Pelagicoccus albus TaxID=415222 RepID=A0A7X1B7M6_9BACT|nr:chemotaxis response regulator protein-glutamate methylesterase [Pelagicoccus albus]MBC2607169.1 chemotaxis response regulator protein-glutamate methylesterase [Pelagicoccus albus]